MGRALGRQMKFATCGRARWLFFSAFAVEFVVQPSDGLESIRRPSSSSAPLGESFLALDRRALHGVLDSNRGHEEPEPVLERGLEKFERQLNKSESVVDERMGKLSDKFENGTEEWMKAINLTPNVDPHSDEKKIWGDTFLICALSALCALGFSCFRLHWPHMYSNNARSEALGGYNIAPWTPSDSFFGWISAGWSVNFGEAQHTVGLDGAFCIDFQSFGMRLLALLAIPNIGILILTELTRENSYVSITVSMHVEDTRPWVLWVRALAIWYVVLVTEYHIFKAMEEFMPKRFEWLKHLDPPQSTSLLVENIPENYCSDEKLKEFFAGLFPNLPKNQVVETAHVLKRTKKLRALIAELEALQIELERKEYGLRYLRNAPTLQRRAAAANTSRELSVAALREAVDMERMRVTQIVDPFEKPPTGQSCSLRNVKSQKLTAEARKIMATSGFVTFTSPNLALLVLNMKCYSDADYFKCSIPPPVYDVLWTDLQKGQSKQLGFTLPRHLPRIGGLFVGIQYNKQSILNAGGCGWIAVLFYVCPFFTVFSSIIERWCHARNEDHCFGLDDFMHTIPLQIYVSFLPTFLMLIFTSCFSMKADAWKQQVLQTVYFWFMLVFTLLISSIGSLIQTSSLHQVVLDMVRNPSEKVLDTLAANMPRFSVWFVTFILMRLTTHFFNLTRYVNMWKYGFYKLFHKKKRAVKLAEPEDQDFYGLGSRSARFTLDLVIGIVFSSIAPIITVITFASCLVARVIYGYLIVFAETSKKKHDTGGTFYVMMLIHLQYGLGLYVLLMWGILRHAGVKGEVQAIVVGLAFLFILVCHRRFRRQFCWETLPFNEVCSPAALKKAEAVRAEFAARNLWADARSLQYIQPELVNDDEKEFMELGNGRGTRE